MPSLSSFFILIFDELGQSFRNDVFTRLIEVVHVSFAVARRRFEVSGLDSFLKVSPFAEASVDGRMRISDVRLKCMVLFGDVLHRR